MATFYADKATSGAQPRGLHEGAVSVRAKYIGAAGTSTSAGDVIQCVKIPRGAIIDAVVYAPLVGEGSTPQIVASIGDGNSVGRYYSGTLSVVTAATAGIGFKYDESVISDAAAVLYDTIDVTIIAGGILTASEGFYLTVTYHNDE